MGLLVQRVAALSPYKTVGLYAAYDMSLETTYANTDPIGTLTNWCTRGTGENLTSSGANRPVCVTSGLNGYRIAQFTAANSSYMAAATASKWAFMSNGSGFTMIAVWRTRSTSNETGYIFDTGANGLGDVGCGLSYSTLVGASHNYMECAAANGGGTAWSVDAASSTYTFPALGVWIQVAARFKYNARCGRNLAADAPLTVLVNGLTAAASTLLAAPSLSNPSAALTIGRAGTGTPFYAETELAAMYLFDVALDDGQMDAVGYWIEDRWNVPYATSLDGGIGYREGFGSTISLNPNSKLYHIGYVREQQDSLSNSVLLMRESANGRDWTYPPRIVYQPTNLANYVGSFHHTWLSNGDAYINTWEGPTNTAVGMNPIWMRSTDGMRTFSAPTTVTTHGFTSWCSSGEDPVHEQGAGILYMPVYGMMTAGTYTSAKLMKSTDNGTTWSVLSTIANGPGDTRSYSEVGIDFLTASKIIAFIRCDTTNSLWYSKSTDTGATWSAPVEFTTPPAHNMPWILTLASGRKLLFLRYLVGGANNSRSVIYWSTDSANDYGNVTTSWHGPYHIDCINGANIAARGYEVSAGNIIVATWSSTGAEETPTGPPGAYPSLSRVMKVKEADIALV